MSIVYRILIVRHGESIWNHDSKFTGWTNIPLSKKGIGEAHDISNQLIKNNLYPNIFFSSVLDRAIDTGNIIKNRINKDHPLHTSWRLNEKHYGTLEGVPRKYIRDMYGEKFTQMMRSNYNMKPPILQDHDFKFEYSSYKNCYFETIKNGESKEDVLKRFLPYYENDILYTLTQNKFPLIISHKHTVRVLMKHLLHLNEAEFEKYELPNKKILNISLDQKFKLIGLNEISY